MTTASSRVVTTKRYEFTVPNPGCLSDFNVAMHWAHRKFEEVKGRSVTYDDDIMISGFDRDEGGLVVISFEAVEK